MEPSSGQSFGAAAAAGQTSNQPASQPASRPGRQADRQAANQTRSQPGNQLQVTDVYRTPRDPEPRVLAQTRGPLSCILLLRSPSTTDTTTTMYYYDYRSRLRPLMLPLGSPPSKPETATTPERDLAGAYFLLGSSKVAFRCFTGLPNRISHLMIVHSY